MALATRGTIALAALFITVPSYAVAGVALDCLPLAQGFAASGSFDDSGAERCFTFPGLDQDVVMFRVTKTDGNLQFLSRFSVTRPGGAMVPCAWYGVYTCSLDTPGQHNLHVASQPGQSGTFNVFMTRLTSPSICRPLVYDQPTPESISAAGELDCFLIVGTPGAITLRLTRTSFLDGFVPEADLHGPDGTRVCGPFATGSSNQIQCTLPGQGFYTVVVRDDGGYPYDTIGTGGYEVGASMVT